VGGSPPKLVSAQGEVDGERFMHLREVTGAGMGGTLARARGDEHGGVVLEGLEGVLDPGVGEGPQQHEEGGLAELQRPRDGRRAPGLLMMLGSSAQGFLSSETPPIGGGMLSVGCVGGAHQGGSHGQRLHAAFSLGEGGDAAINPPPRRARPGRDPAGARGFRGGGALGWGRRPPPRGDRGRPLGGPPAAGRTGAPQKKRHVSGE